VVSQRSRKRSLSTERISRLESLPGWIWNALEGAWEESFSVLEKYVKREGHAFVPRSHIEDEIRLGAWVNIQRNYKERYSKERVSRLGSLQGWTWNVLEAAWEEGFFALEKYVAREGQARVLKSHTETGFRLGQWVGVQRRGGKGLSRERISRLESLRGWTWNSPEAAWEEAWYALEKYIAKERHARVPRSYTEDGLYLGQWVNKQRSTRKRLPAERISRLASLSGWTWDPQESAWEEGFSALEKYVEREGNAHVPRPHIEDAFHLGRWVNSQRNAQKGLFGKGLSAERISRLESLQGWTWNVLETSWEESFSVLEKYVKREGHAFVPRSHIEDEIRLGAWVNAQRRMKESLSPERFSRLESLQGWVWNAPEAAWEGGFSALGKYVAREGHARVSQSHIEDGFNVGQWVGVQRGAKERLPTERISRLESLPGWVWNAR